MKVKDLIKELSALDGECDILAYLYDEYSDVEFECDFKVDYDVAPYLNLEEIKRYWCMKVKDFLEYFKDFDSESELKFDLFEQTYYDELWWRGQDYYTKLDFTDIKNNDGICKITFKLEEWGGGMKYYIYGTRELPSEYGYQPEGYLCKESYTFKYILKAMELAQYKYQMHLKIGIVDNFNATLIYENKKSDKEMTEHGLTFVGTAEWKFDPPNVFLTLNEDLKAKILLLN